MLDEIYGEDQMEVANCIYGKERRFVPLVFLNKAKVGGFGELFEMQKAGTLTKAE
jgi:glutaredoxin